ncbi:hypothetical protein FOL01_1096 [Weissella jogaejeotgali]|uniref:Uncharacterized protein n=1 Tax=Weissella jogaejeotgali TaxID=1631871 RepID=A0A1L6RBP2_9LACO|nr:hypothetical protein FOL01_1096 [Weissella jogaejeotgali]
MWVILVEGHQNLTILNLKNNSQPFPLAADYFEVWHLQKLHEQFQDFHIRCKI